MELYDNLERWDGEDGGRVVQEGGDICIPMANSCSCMEKPPQLKPIVKQFVVVVQSLSCVQQFVTPWPAYTRLPCPSLSPTVCSDSCQFSRWGHPASSSSVAPFSCPFSISPSSEYSGLISFRVDWFDLAVQGTLKNLFQDSNSKVSVLQCSAFFMVQLSHLYVTTGKAELCSAALFLVSCVDGLDPTTLQRVTLHGVLVDGSYDMSNPKTKLESKFRVFCSLGFFIPFGFGLWKHREHVPVSSKKPTRCPHPKPSTLSRGRELQAGVSYECTQKPNAEIHKKEYDLTK